MKIESSKGGMDPFRFFGTGEDPNLSPRFLEFNRNKRSFTVNLKHPKAKACCTTWSPRPTRARQLQRRRRRSYRVGLQTALCSETRHHQFTHARTRTTGPKRHFSTVGVNITAFTGLTYMWNHPGVTNPPIGAQLVYPITFPACCARLSLFQACFIATGRRKARSSTWRSPKRRRS